MTSEHSERSNITQHSTTRHKKPMFSKRHYEFIADILRRWNGQTRTGLILDFSRAFEDDNPNFDESKFCEASK